MSTNANASNSVAKKVTKATQRKTRSIPNAITLAIGAELRVQREARGLTQLNLALNAEVERTRISKLELGLVNPSVLSLASICHVLGITLADLFADVRLSHPPTAQGGELRRANQAVLDKPAKPPPKAKAGSRSTGMPAKG